MHCPHCQGRLPAHRPVTDPSRYKLYAQHGEMELDAGRFKALVNHAREHILARRATAAMLRKLEAYVEVVERLEYDPAFASHLLDYDGDGGRRLFPGSTRAARLAELKGRLAKGQAREDDLLRYIRLMTGE